MQKTKVVNLGQVRDLLAEWEQVRQHITNGNIDGFYTAFRGPAGETIYLGGVYKDDPQAALKAAMRLSAAIVLSEDGPPMFGT